MTAFIGGNARGAESFGVQRDQIASLFVGDLHPDVSEFILHQTFSPFGPIQSVRVCRDRVTLRSLRYGYVNFVNLADAERALETLIFQDLLGRPMRIMFSQRDSTVRKIGIGNIFIKGLSRRIDGVSLYDTFSYFGKILSCKVVGDENGSKGYGFVHFTTFKAAEKAIRALDGMLLDDQIVSICHFKCFEERQKPAHENMEKRHYPGVSLYVSNLPYSFSEQQLYRAFSPFGCIISIKLMMESGRSRGFGFISFSTLEDAVTAVSIMNGRVVSGRALRVTLSHYNEQKTQLEKQESSSELLPAGEFRSAVPQASTHHVRHPTQRLVLLPITRQIAVDVLAQSENLWPLMPVVLLDTVSTETPRLLASQVLLDYWKNQEAFDVWRPRRLLALPAPSEDTEDMITHLEDLKKKGQTTTSDARPKTSGVVSSSMTRVHQKSAFLQIASEISENLPDGAVAPARTEAQQLCDSPHQSPSMWGCWFWMTLDRYLMSRGLSCTTSWSIMNLQSARRSYKWSYSRSSYLQK